MADIQNPFFNPVPASSFQGLSAIEGLKGRLRTLKLRTYDPEERPKGKKSRTPYLPTTVSPNELRQSIDRESGIVHGQLAYEANAIRTGFEEILSQTAMLGVFPMWFEPDELVQYSLRVEGRNKQRMLGQVDDPQRGFTKSQTKIVALPAKEWPSAWGEYVFLDNVVDSLDMGPYMPENADYLLSTVHKFESLKAGSDHPNGRSLHWRLKSGAELLWKMTAYLTGIEGRSGKPRDDIVDTAGMRLICEPEDFCEYFCRLIILWNIT